MESHPTAAIRCEEEHESSGRCARGIVAVVARRQRRQRQVPGTTEGAKPAQRAVPASHDACPRSTALGACLKFGIGVLHGCSRCCEVAKHTASGSSLGIPQLAPEQLGGARLAPVQPPPVLRLQGQEAPLWSTVGSVAASSSKNHNASSSPSSPSKLCNE